MSDTTANNSADYVLLTRLADEFAARYRAGERPSLTEYTDRYPALADEIHDLFPAMVEIEQVKDDHRQETDQRSAPSFPGLEQVGDFRIIREVGKGGMGIVYEAEQVSLGRHVALKVLPRNMLLDQKAKRRFEREAKSAARLHHTNIVPVFGVGEQDDMPYYVMQFIQGLGLDQVLDELKKLQLGHVQTGTFTGTGALISRKEVSAVNVARSLMAGDFEWASDQDHEKTTPVTVHRAFEENPPGNPSLSPSPSDTFTLSSSSVVLPGERRDGSKSKGRRKSYWRSVATIGVQVADALEYAHKQGVHHRDVKPSNLLLDTQATVWVTDFGLAKANDQQNLTHTGDILGTLRYMPPEAFEGMTDVRSDVYSLGLTLYEMLAFRPAFDETDRNRLVRQVTCDVPVRLGKLNRQVPQDLETIVHKAIERDASKRYSSAGDLAADLQRFIDDEPIAARRVSPAERTWRWCKRNRALATASALAAAGLVAVSVFAVSYALAQARSNRALLAEQRQTRAERDRVEKLAAELSGALSETKKQESMLAVEKGQALIGQGQLYPGMLWMARGLEVAPAEAVSLQDSIRASLASLRGEVPVRRLELPTPDAGGVAFSPDGKTILTAGGGEAWLWDAVTGQQIGKPWPLGDAFTAMAFSPDSQRVITASANLSAGTAQARLWDARQGSLLRDPVPMVGIITSLAFSPDGKTVLVAAGSYPLSIGEAWFWDAGSLEPRVQLSGYAGRISAVAYCYDGKTCVIANRNANDGNSDLGFWDTATLKPSGKTIAIAGSVMDVVLTPDAKGIITGSFNKTGRGEVRFWDRATGVEVNRPLEFNDIIHSVAVSPDGRFLATTTANFISKRSEAQLWEMSTAKVVGAPIALSGGFPKVAFSPDGRAILTSANLQAPNLWQLPSDRLIGPIFAHQESVSAIAFSPDGKLIATGTGTVGKKGVAQRWNAATGEPIGPPLPQPGYVLAVTFSPDGKKLATGIGYLGQNKGEARLWDAVTGKPIGFPLPHQNDVTDLAFSPDGTMLLTGCKDHTARIWDARTGLPVGMKLRHPGRVTRVAFSPDGQTVLTGCEDGIARVWDPATAVAGENARLVRWVEVESGKELTAERSVRTLDEATLIKRRETLTSLGGPLEGRQGWFSWHMQQAIQCGDTGLWRAAIWHLDREVRDHPQDALAFVLRTRANLELEQSDQADADFARALAVAGTPASVFSSFHAFADAAIENKRPKLALWYLDRLIRAGPHDAAAWLKRGQIESQQAHWQQASADMTRGVELDGSLYSNWTRALTLNAYSGDVANYHRLRTAAIKRFRHTSEYQIAERIARSCLLVPASAGELGLICELAHRSLRLGFESVTRTYIELANGMAAYRGGRFSSAIDWLRSSPSLIDRRRELTNKAFLAMAYYRSGQSQKAWLALAEARTLLDHLPQPAGDLALETQVTGQNEWLSSQIAYREAAAILETAHRRETDSLLAKHEWSNALGLLDAMIAADPRFWVDWVSRSCARAEMGRQVDADADFKRAIELSKGGHDPWLMRGRFHRDLNRPDQAAADFAQALNLIPDGREWERERMLTCKDLYSSESIFARLMELRPQDAGLYSARARSLAGRKAWEKAIGDFDQATRLRPSDGKLSLERAECLANLGRLEEAAADYARGLPSDLGSPSAWYEAALAHLGAGKIDEYKHICAEMYARFGGATNSEIAQRISYALADRSDVGAVVPLAQFEVRAAGTAAFGAALYRAGKWEEAVSEFDHPGRGASGFRLAWQWLFRAMAHAQLRDPTSARQYLDRAQKWFDEASRQESTRPTWVQRVEFQTVRREAEELLNQK